MRLIDADELLNQYSEDKQNEFSFIPLYEVRNNIKRAPTINPVKHGHWVRVARSGSEYWQCSNCHGYFTLPMPKYRGFYMRYCGCCGAKMDFEEAKTETD